MLFLFRKKVDVKLSLDYWNDSRRNIFDQVFPSVIFIPMVINFLPVFRKDSMQPDRLQPRNPRNPLRPALCMSGWNFFPKSLIAEMSLKQR